MIRVVLDEGAILPQRAYETDGGLDLFAREDQCVPAKEHAEFDTGVHIEIPKGYVGLVKSKSGLCFKKNLICDGVIDCGYTGSVNVKLFNLGGYDYKVKKGDKIAQLVIVPVLLDKLEVVDKLSEEHSGRGSSGFGSTGR